MKLTTKQRVLSVALAMLILPTIAKLLLYEFGGGRRIRQAVGNEVSFVHNNKIYKGKLNRAEYRFNDKWGWFDFHIEVRYDGGAVSTGLTPSEASDLNIHASNQTPSAPRTNA